MKDLNEIRRRLRREESSHKGNFGRVLFVGGSRGMAGSIALSGLAALRCGSGLVSVAVPDRCLETVASVHPSLMTIPLPDDHQGRFSDKVRSEIPFRWSGFDAIGIGPGMRTGAGSIALVERTLSLSKPSRVLDADAINVLAEQKFLDKESGFSLDGVVMTPHPGELERLTGVSAKDRDAQIDAASQWSSRTGAIIVVKGGPTVVVSGKDRYINETGNSGMATAGSGDVLTGIVTSLLGQGLSAWDAARFGVHQHGAAGDRATKKWGMAAMTALDLVNEIRVD